jgi:hypothetical protein
MEAWMAKFYFGYQKTTGPVAQDEVGLDLPGLEEARAAAVASARELISDDVKFARNDPLIAVIVTNEEGQELMRIAAKDVLPVQLR